MARRSTETSDIARRYAPIVLGILLAAFIIDALFTRSPEEIGVYNGLTIVALFFSAVFASLFVAALLGRREVWRLWAILLGATIGIWIAGALMHIYLPPIQLKLLV